MSEVANPGGRIRAILNKEYEERAYFYRKPFEIREGEMKEKLVNFDLLPLGARMRYQGSKTIWVVLSKYRENTDTEPMSGLLVEFTEELSSRGSTVTHFGGMGDCPEMVYHVTGGIE